MSLKKLNKRDVKSKLKDEITNSVPRSKAPKKGKTKYKHKTYWLEEEMNDIVAHRMKKKSTEKR